MKKKDCKDWKFEQINREFGYKRYYKNFEPLNNFLNANEPLTETEIDSLKILSKEFLYNIEAWNSEEVKFFFLSPLKNW